MGEIRHTPFGKAFLFVSAVLVLAFIIIALSYKPVCQRCELVVSALRGTPSPTAVQVPGLEGRDLKLFQRRGLDDPAENLKDDLARHPELIPFKGTLGGTMGFHDREKIVILSSRWAIAGFDDGHTAGSLLLAYEVGEKGAIRWKVLDAVRD